MTNERARRIVDASVEAALADAPIDEPALDGDTLTAEAPIADDTTSETLADAPVDLVTVEDPDVEIAEPAAEPPEAADEETIEAASDEDAAPNADADRQPVADLEVEDTIEAGADTDEADDDATDADLESLPRMLEAILFVADDPVATSELGRALELTPRQIRRGLDDLADKLREAGHGIRLQQGPDGAQLVTAPEMAATVELFLGLEANRRLSSAALETLAIIAYRQPVTRHAIDQIRGVNSDGAIATLRARGLIEGVGRAPGPGRPLLFSTTQRFLEHFGLERPDQLPPLPDDVEMPPEAEGAQFALESAVRTETAASPSTDEPSELSALDPAADAGDETFAEDTLAEDEDSEDDEDLEEFDDLDDFDELEDDLELEISDDVEDLSRAAGAAFASPVEASDSSN
ncbi:MAG: SMC-Scp complex subunit ScpB [Chloroflexi bacterium]|nr:SMC-Scp complex subunit ScpB [Chloroflexota bacterium]MDA1146742.1 SMC-Scp complex subunit ScpB [Chloroflexota bacterium]